MEQFILIVEDDPDIAKLIKLHLSESNFTVEIATSGSAGLQRAREHKFDLIILDVMLPGLTGTDVCQSIRKFDSSVAILMLTVKSDLIDKVLGLELGADDYMTKPFDVQELVARVRALLRRSSIEDQDVLEAKKKVLEIGPIRIDREKHKVWKNDQEIDLTPKQFDLLYFLARSPGRTFTRQDLLNYVWKYESKGYGHTVDSTINRLRSKIEEDQSAPELILTVWGVGYKFAETL